MADATQALNAALDDAPAEVKAARAALNRAYETLEAKRLAHVEANAAAWAAHGEFQAAQRRVEETRSFAVVKSMSPCRLFRH